MSAFSSALPNAVALLLQVAMCLCLAEQCDAGNVWREPADALPSRHADSVEGVEQLYAHALDLYSSECESCIDHFFEVALRTAPRPDPGDSGACCNLTDDRTRHLHESAIRKLVVAGQHFGRFDPSRGLGVVRSGVVQWIPISHHRFVWQRCQFSRLIPVGDYHVKSLRTTHRRGGVGVPMVAISDCSNENAFLSPKSAFPATLRLHVEPHGRQHDAGDATRGTRFELYDSRRTESVRIGDSDYPIAKDLTAAFAYRIATRPSNVLNRFIRPTSLSPDTRSARGNLYTVEPYQRGKTPIIFIHGLLSDPFTWANLINDLYARPEFVQNFQIWVFEYPTGIAFLASGAELRHQLESACRSFDPSAGDPELHDLLVVGHSMGGLVAKLQVTSSGNRVWSSIANRPLNEIVMSEELRQRIGRSVYFQASPRITRVVYMATPHRGSAFASRFIGKIGAALVQEPDREIEEYEALLRNNPNTFSYEMSRRIPTSIDLLEPTSPLLQAVDSLPLRCGVAVHSIIGDRCWTLALGRSDGVVPVENARDRHAMTERIVNATHSGVKDHPDSMDEFHSILELHLTHSAAQSSPTMIGSSGVLHAF